MHKHVFGTLNWDLTCSTSDLWPLWWWRVWICWSLLYIALFSALQQITVLTCDSVGMIHFYSTFWNIHRSGVLTVLAWLVPHETAAISAHSVYTVQPKTVSLHAKPHTYGACIFSCYLSPALLAAWPGSFTSYSGNTGVEEILKQESAQKVDPGEENYPAAPAGVRTCDLLITNLVL